MRIFRRLHRHARPWRAISRSTALWFTVMPSRASCAVTRENCRRQLPALLSHRAIFPCHTCSEHLQDHQGSLTTDAQLGSGIPATCLPQVAHLGLDTFAGVVASENTLGWERLTALDDEPLRRLVRPIGLASACVRYLGSLVRFIDQVGMSGIDLATAHPDDLIASSATGVDGVGYNTAQCAVLPRPAPGTRAASAGRTDRAL